MRLLGIPTKVREVKMVPNLNLTHTLKRSLGLLPHRDRVKVRLVITLQIAIAGLDLLGIALIGVLSALAVNGVRSQPAGDRVNSFLELLHIENLSFQSQAGILGALAATLLVGRTLISIVFARRTYFFLSRRSAYISHQLVGKLLQQSLIRHLNSTSQEMLYAITAGVNAITLRIIGSLITLISDGALLIVIFLGLLVLDPIVAMSTLALFGSIAFVLYKLMHQKAERLGLQEAGLTISSNKLILEVLETYRETVVRNRQPYYTNKIGKIRYELSDVIAEITFMPNISKYVVEIAIVIGALALSVTQFLLQDATHAIATLAVFLAAGSRIAPAVLRLQQGAISIRGAAGAASPTLDLIEELQDHPELPSEELREDFNHVGFDANVTLEKVNFKYQDSTNFSLQEIDVSIPSGSFVAIVGPSGAGKTTLVDLILGLLEPESGLVRISGQNPTDIPKSWPGVMGYVPQDIYIADASVLENICLGFSIEHANLRQIEKAIATSQFSQVIKGLEKGLDSQVGERGTKLSGGERQRLGIARALYTNPKLLILDEASSALDSQTELDLGQAIQALKGEVTVIMIAHRLSTVRRADQVIYMVDGTIKATGTFDEVRKAIPDFDSQASLMGL